MGVVGKEGQAAGWIARCNCFVSKLKSTQCCMLALLLKIVSCTRSRGGIILTSFFLITSRKRKRRKAIKSCLGVANGLLKMSKKAVDVGEDVCCAGSRFSCGRV